MAISCAHEGAIILTNSADQLRDAMSVDKEMAVEALTSGAAPETALVSRRMRALGKDDQ